MVMPWLILVLVVLVPASGRTTEAFDLQANAGKESELQLDSDSRALDIGEAFFEHLTVDEGLPGNSVRAMVQDRFGFLWIGTQNGLVRFDGSEMVQYRRLGAESGGFGGRIIESLYEDRAGDLWIGTFLMGLWRLDRSTGVFSAYPVAFGEDGDEGSPPVWDICEDAAGRIWVALAQYGIARIEPRNGTISPFLRPGTAGGLSPGDVVTSVQAVDSGTLWVGTTESGILVIDDAGHRIEGSADAAGISGSLPKADVNQIFRDAGGQIWVTTDDGLGRWEAGARRFTVFRPAPGATGNLVNHLGDVVEDRRGRLWLSSFQGLYFFDPTLEVFRRFSNDPQRSNSLTIGPILSVLVDRGGVVWAGSWHTGLNKLVPDRQIFDICRRESVDAAGLSDETVVPLHQDLKGVLWAGSSISGSGGMRACLNRHADRNCGFTRFPLPDIGPGGPRAVQAISDDPDGGLWLGTDRGLWHFDSGSREFEARSREADTEISVDSTSIRCLLTDAAGDVWIGTIGRGLYRRDRSTGRLIQFTNDPSVPGSLSQDIIIALDQDHLGRVWIGTDSRGVDLFEPSSGSFRHFYDPALGLSTVVDILEDSRGRIWLATLAGLFQIDPEEGVVAVFDSLKGLPNDMIAGVLEDERGRLWLSTGRGLAWLDPESGRVGIFDSADGLHSDQIYYAHCRLSDGRMVFGANRGLVFFDPARAQPCAFVPPVVITGVAVADRPLAVGGESPLQHPPFLADELVLGAQQNDLSLTFSALDFARPGKNRYRYRLVPYDSSWRDSGPGHKAVYTNLDPGSYLFRVQGSNMDGLWNEDGASLRIVIRPPWWRTAWAIGLYVLAMCILLWTGHRLLLTRQRMRDELRLQQEGARQLQELDELKSRLFANISHEIRTPLTIIRGQLERLFASLNGADREVVAMVVRNAERLGHLLDQLLDLSRLDAGKLPLEWQRDEDLGALRRLVSTFDPLALLRDITLVMDISDQPMTVWIEPDVLDKVVGNLLGNALKYTPSGGDVRVTAVWDQSVKWVVAEGTARVRAAPGGDAEGAIRARTLIVSVANSGSFIPSDQMDRVFERFHQMHTQGSNLEGSGIGLALVKELLEVIGGSVTVESSKTAGTKFIARLPCLAEEPVDGRRRDPLGERELLQSGREPLRKVRTVERASEITVEEEGDTVMMRPLLLLVEDHPDMRAYMRDVLASTYRLIEAPDGEQALPLAVSESPDLIVSDVMMPGMDGFDLCRRLAATTSTSHIPVILLTALADSQSRREGLQAGAVEYLSKPFDAEELRVRIRNLLERQWRLSERLTRLILEVERPVLPGETSDERYLRRLRQAVDHNLDDPLLRVEDLCREIDTSRSQLHRKLKTLTGMTATAFIRQHRLMRAAELLAGGHDYVTGVAYAVGFRSLSYFARSFREQYGVLPSEYEGNPTIGT